VRDALEDIPAIPRSVYCKVKFYPNRERERDGQIERFYPKFFGYERDRDGQKERVDFG
jgi:hypothetical protein